MRKKTLQQAQEALDAAFPGAKLLLKTYSGALKPCVLVCQKHGEVTAYSYNNVIRSSLGCPKCGIESKNTALTLNRGNFHP